EAVEQPGDEGMVESADQVALPLGEDMERAVAQPYLALGRVLTRLEPEVGEGFDKRLRRAGVTGQLPPLPGVLPTAFEGVPLGGAAGVVRASGDGVCEDLADELVAALRNAEIDPLGRRLIHLRRPSPASRLVTRRLVAGGEQLRLHQLVEMKRGQVPGDRVRVGGLLPGDRMTLAAYALVEPAAHRVDQRRHGLPRCPGHVPQIITSARY